MEREWLKSGVKNAHDIGTNKNKFITSPSGNLIGSTQVRKLLNNGKNYLNTKTFTVYPEQL